MAIPALIVSGYLGSGKTTTVSHLLREAQREGVRLAVISNEFGDTGIDRALLEAGEEGFVELDGGCVCCRLSDALGETVERIIDLTRPDRLVLETSGVALPGEVQLQFWRPPISELVSDEAVAVLVDAERFVAGDIPGETSLQQIDAADVLVLNKCDLVDAAGLAQAEQGLREIAIDRPILRAVRGEVEPAALFPADPEGRRVARRDAEAALQPHSHERFGTEELQFDGVVQVQEVVERIRVAGVVRAKGFVRTPQGLRLVQGVGQRVEVSPPPTDVAPALVGKVVLIRHMSRLERGD